MRMTVGLSAAGVAAHGYKLHWRGCAGGLWRDRLGLTSAPSDIHESQVGCRMGWARSCLPLNHMKGVFGLAEGVTRLQHSTVRTRMGVDG